MWAFDEIVDARRRAADAAVRARRRSRTTHASSSTSTWRSTATSTSRSRCSRASSSSRSCSTSRPASCCRPTCPMRSARCRSSPSGRPRAAPPAARASRCASSRARTSRWSASTRRVHDWPLATCGTKQDTDTNYKRVLDWALTPEHTDAVRIGVAGHNLFDIAFAWLLAKRRGVDDPRRVRDAARHGDRPGRGRASTTSAGCCSTRRSCTRTSSTSRSATSSAASRRTRAPRTSCRACSSSRRTPASSTRERDRFLASLADARRSSRARAPHRVQDRAARRGVAATPARGFENEADTDPALAANREWGARHPRRAARLAARHRHDRSRRASTEPSSSSELIAARRRRRRDVGRAARGRARAVLLDRAGDVLAAFRGRLIEVMAQRDRQDDRRGRRRGQRGHRLRALLRRARAASSTASTARRSCRRGSPSSRRRGTSRSRSPPAACSRRSPRAAACIFKPAPQAQRCGAVMAEALWEAGVPRDLLALVDVEEARPRAQQLIAHPAVDRVILTGAYETAALFRSWRPDLPLLAETSGKNAIIVTPSADLDLAVADVVQSAFGHAGQKCSAASLVILVGSVAQSRAVPPPARRCRDARCASGWPQDPHPARWARSSSRRRASCSSALTTLDEGERGCVEPQPARRDRPAVVARRARRGRGGQRVPPDRVLRSGARHHDGAARSTRRSRCRTRSTTG